MPNIINTMYIQKLKEMILHLAKNTVGVCNQITFLISYYISSRLVTLPIKVSDIFYLTVNYKFINFSFQIFLLIVPEMSVSVMIYTVSIIYIV